MIKIYFPQFIFFIVMLFAEANFSANAQGTGNHLTMYIDNCIQTAPNKIRFDMYAVSDGAANSDLRANAFQFGVNFNTAILQAGATITPSFVNGTSDFIPPLNGFCFPSGIAPDHIRVVENIYGGGNTNNKMIVGHPYRIGTFELTSSANWVSGNSSNFSLQAPIAIGKTVTEGLVYIGNTAYTTSIYITGTTDSTRSIYVNCNLVLKSESELAVSSQIYIYPNPSFGFINLEMDKYTRNGMITISNVLGEKVYSESFNGERKTVYYKLSPGVYLVELNTDEDLYSQKIIIQ